MAITPSTFTAQRVSTGKVANKPARDAKTLLEAFLLTQSEIEAHKSGKPVVVDGYNLSIADIVAAARYGSSVSLTDSPAIRKKVDASRDTIQGKLDAGHSVYGLSTGFGGSADTRTGNALVLGKSLLQMQNCAVSPQSQEPLDVLPLNTDPISNNTMPEAWVRAAILIRMNSLIRGHSGVRWGFIEALQKLLQENITPCVPLRGSISASGDLIPLSYVASTLMGNPNIRVFDGPAAFGPRKLIPAPEAFANHGLKHVVFEAKEHLGLLNGTAFTAAVAILALNDSLHVALLSQVCTAMGTEALLGTQASHVPFIHDEARPHPGQIESAKNIYDLLEGSSLADTGEEKELSIEEDTGKLRQDRYALRTAPQFIGPQLEDILSALVALTTEANSTTDNPLVDGETGHVHHGGNFQAMAVTNAMEKTRLSLHHFGKILFAQFTELLNPAFNRGLPPSLAGSDPSLNYFAKGLDIASASYVSELGYLANPVSTHIQSAEMHNQAINSLGLISARATITSIEVLSILIAGYLYVLCQALDLRALQREFDRELQTILAEEVNRHFGNVIPCLTAQTDLTSTLLEAIRDALETSTTQDAGPRLEAVAAATTTPLVNYFISWPSNAEIFVAIGAFRNGLAARSTTLLQQLRHDYLSGARGPTPAAPFLGKTRPVYEFIRETLGIKMHGIENYDKFANGFGNSTVGDNVSKIYESIRNGKLQAITSGLFA
ncbi:phenylalanine ammonia-lyase [Cantharellus anzutake]|uniref:phenylalanine ammonia-lyase n=1 Tax=Cantharellus anzutake TaxID=1750568 RepID=UPI001907EB5E|nr:phenylalanine ammonia-lyase [Cantharellus anzutake]KAF8336349.1 phenylalanine ammonia-lyase [Cantharellus anzutake]